jgi:hypothetical protein
MAIPSKVPITPRKFEFSGNNQGLESNQYPKDISSLKSGIDPSSFHINYLKSQLIRDLARPNLFKVNIVPPDDIYKKAEWQNIDKLITAFAKKADFPQISIKEYLLERAGQKLFIPTNEVNYGDVSITFINDSDFNLRSMFNNWQRVAIYNWEENKGSIPLLAMQGHVSIHQFDSQLNEVYAIELTNAWPQTISAIELSQDTENAVEEFTVTFKFTMHNIYKKYT